MLDMPVFDVAVERVEVDEVRDVGVCRRAVVAFVEVISQDLPVVVPVQLVRMVEVVYVKVVRLVPFLLVNVLEVLLPWDLGSFLCVHVHPDKAVDIDLDVDPEQPVLILVEPIQILVPGSLGQLPVKPVGPPVVSTRQDLVVSLALFLDNRIRTVPAHIVERIDLAIAVPRDDKIEAGDLVAQPVARVLESRAVGDKEPSFGEDRAALQLVHLLRGVPRGGQSTHRGRAVWRRFLGGGVVSVAEVVQH